MRKSNCLDIHINAYIRYPIPPQLIMFCVNNEKKKILIRILNKIGLTISEKSLRVPRHYRKINTILPQEVKCIVYSTIITLFKKIQIQNITTHQHVSTNLRDESSRVFGPWNAGLNPPSPLSFQDFWWLQHFSGTLCTFLSTLLGLCSPTQLKSKVWKLDISIKKQCV